MPTCPRHYPGRSDGAIRSSVSIVSGLPCETVRSAPAIIVSGPAQRSLSLWPARSPSRLATLSTEGSDSFVASAAASIATGWSEPVPGRELHPLKPSAFSRRTVSTIIVKTHTKVAVANGYWRSREAGCSVLKSRVQTEDIADLKGGSIVHHEVATDNYVYIVWRRRRKHRFQLAWTRLDLLLQAGRQTSIHDQLAL